eukprot:COSAG02_NODE_901_length_16056_cov_52.549477_9_plen_324_part_00
MAAPLPSGLLLPNTVGNYAPQEEQLMDTIVIEGAAERTPAPGPSSAASVAKVAFKLTDEASPPAPSGPSPTTRLRRAPDAQAHMQEQALTSGPSRQLWEAWRTVDADGSGTVSRAEFQAVHTVLGIPKDSVTEAWLEAVCHMNGKPKSSLTLFDSVRVQSAECNYAAFQHAFNAVRGTQHRARRQLVRSSFLSQQSSAQGVNKLEFAKFAKRMQRHLMLLPPAFDITQDWETVLSMSRTHLTKRAVGSKTEQGGTGVNSRSRSSTRAFADMGSLLNEVDDQDQKASEDEVLVSFPEFEIWWKFRMVTTIAAQRHPATQCHTAA